MTKNKVLFIVFSLLITFVGCKKTTTDPVMYNPQFPLRVGSQWKYLTIANNTSTDTVLVKVRSYTTGSSLYDSNYICNIYVNSVLMDSAQLTRSDIGLTLSPLSSQALFQGFQVLFPLYNGQTWSFEAWDSSHVTYLSTYAGKDSTYHNAYQVDHYVAGSGNLTEAQTLILVPNVGIVYRTYSGNTYGPGTNTYEYVLVNFQY